MIQRVQSIFLTLVFVAMIVSSIMPHWQKFDPDSPEFVQLTAVKLTHYEDVQTMEVRSESWTFYIALTALIAAGMAVYSVFCYKNRLLQIKLGALNSLFMGASLILSVYFSMEGEKMLAQQIKGVYLTGFYSVFAALIFNLLSNRFIRRDDKLVRSVDRIR